jgi:hypothetical protein
VHKTQLPLNCHCGTIYASPSVYMVYVVIDASGPYPETSYYRLQNNQEALRWSLDLDLLKQQVLCHWLFQLIVCFQSFCYNIIFILPL